MNALVTGGGGFVGGAIVRRLLERGARVTSLSRGRYPALEEQGVRCLQADLGDARAVLAAFDEPYDVVFHTAALTGVWGPRADFFRANVEGTRHVVAACFERGVERLVFTSSPSVCFDGTDHRNARNDLPYARTFLAAYPESKARAEALVLAANGRGRLATCALRPHLVFGPGDPHLLPRVVARARAGRLARVGDGQNEVTVCYVDNAAWAHLDAADALGAGGACAGRAYFVGQEEPVRLWPWIDDLLGRLGLPPVRRRVPRRVAAAAGAVLEGLWRVAHRATEPPLTRFVAAQLSTSHSYDLAPVREDLGYRERVGMEEAVELAVRDLRARGLAG